ncbi:MAG: DUF4225 domain-containing protein [Pseudomonas sp.]|uniref:DUF4225 domain-containing protein n=1 Tax=Pseudomonas sp. TaxID=306 RepID=UPI002FCC91D2
MKGEVEESDFWEVSQAAGCLTNQACSISARHIKDGMLRLQFNREVAGVAKHIVSKVATGEMTSAQGLRALEDEKANLLRQSAEIAMKGVGLIAGVLQMVTGGSICYFSAGSLCAVAGLPLIAHGANNTYENARNLIGNRDDSEGFVRKGYQSLAKVAGGSSREGNIAYGVVDIGLSIYTMRRLVLKPSAWRLFRYVREDYVKSYATMGRKAIAFEIGIDVMTGTLIYVESEK